MSFLLPQQLAYHPCAGIFSRHQPAYAERGIATFPLNDNKLPAIRNYQKVGLSASAKFAERFRAAPALGFMTDARSRVTVLDIDTTDEHVLADAANRHGSTPMIARTASGKFHAFYRHNGELRKIRPFGELPIDLLGIGGFVVGVPSRVAGGEYSFVEGSLHDITRLPVMRGLDPAMYRRREAPLTPVAQPTGLDAVDGVMTTSEGARNHELWRYCMQQMSLNKFDIDAVIAAARIRNSTYSPPLPDDEVVKTAASAWGYTASGRNWFGKAQVVTSHVEVDELLIEAPDAFLLLVKLRRHNWGQTFMVANTMSKTMGWTRKRLAAAREELTRRGKIVCTRKAHSAAPALYAWGQQT
jgi:Bifunctional DNA primase/polymerase, N-terminal